MSVPNPEGYAKHVGEGVRAEGARAERERIAADLAARGVERAHLGDDEAGGVLADAARLVREGVRNAS